jgi:hypothetical protein
MNYFLLIGSIILFSSGSFCQTTNSNNFPKYEVVVSFLNDHIDRPCLDCSFGVAKKKDGYYLVVKTVADAEITDRKFFKVWDAESNKYTVPNVDPFLIEVPADEQYDNRLSELQYEAARYDLFHVYGYPEWIDDLHAMLDTKKDLTLKECEMLARAYSEQAGDYIHPNQYGNNFSFSKRFNDPLYEKLPADRIQKCIQLADLSLSYYDRIRQKNPDYQPIIITDLELKINHDLMHYFEYLNSVKEPELAAKYLNKVNYNPGYLAYAKNILDACSENSILITYGDTDSYPLWYLQNKNNYRKDVLVMNNSLMQTAWYMTMVFEISGLNTTLSKEDLIAYSKEYFLFEEESEPMEFDKWMDYVKSQFSAAINSRLENPGSEEYFAPLISSKLNLNVAGEAHDISFRSYYISMLDILMVDLIGNNPGRKIFTTSPSGFLNLNLYTNFASRCGAYELKSAAQSNYADAATADHLEKKIGQLTPQLIDQMHDVGERDLMTVYAEILNASNNVSKQQAIFRTMRSKFTKEYLISKNNPELIQAAEETYFNLDQELAADLRKTNVPNALKYIESANLNNSDLATMISDLEYIFRTYSGADYTLQVNHSRKLDPSDEKVIKALKKKIDNLLKSKECAKLFWSKERLQSLSEALKNS